MQKQYVLDFVYILKKQNFFLHFSTNQNVIVIHCLFFNNLITEI